LYEGNVDATYSVADGGSVNENGVSGSDGGAEQQKGARDESEFSLSEYSQDPLTLFTDFWNMQKPENSASVPVANVTGVSASTNIMTSPTLKLPVLNTSSLPPRDANGTAAWGTSGTNGSTAHVTALAGQEQEGFNEVDLHTAVLGEGIRVVQELLDGASSTAALERSAPATGTAVAATAAAAAAAAAVAGSRTSGGRGGASSSRVREVSLDNIRLQNFGPFEGLTQYPLCKRGLVLVRGEADDGLGADSNGAGKTTLLMSAMWALTGQLDARIVSDSKVGDVAFDAPPTTVAGGTHAASVLARRRVAEVTVSGQINGQEFSVTRKRRGSSSGGSGRSLSELRFIVGGNDLSCQSMRDTQVRIDELLGTGNNLLSRCCFFGQHSHATNSLLGLSDAQLKTELAILADIDLWAAAQSHVRSRLRENKQLIAALEVELRVRREDLRTQVLFFFSVACHLYLCLLFSLHVPKYPEGLTLTSTLSALTPYARTPTLALGCTSNNPNPNP
jgi:hypothetical protein